MWPDKFTNTETVFGTCMHMVEESKGKECKASYPMTSWIQSMRISWDNCTAPAAQVISIMNEIAFLVPEARDLWSHTQLHLRTLHTAKCIFCTTQRFWNAPCWGAQNPLFKATSGRRESGNGYNILMTADLTPQAGSSLFLFYSNILSFKFSGELQVPFQPWH